MMGSLSSTGTCTETPRDLISFHHFQQHLIIIIIAKHKRLHLKFSSYFTDKSFDGAFLGMLPNFFCPLTVSC